jgi:hypothetical protein
MGCSMACSPPMPYIFGSSLRPPVCPETGGWGTSGRSSSSAPRVPMPSSGQVRDCACRGHNGCDTLA